MKFDDVLRITFSGLGRGLEAALTAAGEPHWGRIMGIATPFIAEAYYELFGKMSVDDLQLPMADIEKMFRAGNDAIDAAVRKRIDELRRTQPGTLGYGKPE